MRDLISNSSLQPSILFNSFHRLYIVTGKGGVGKTTTAMGLCSYLKNEGKKVAYLAFDQESNDSLLSKLQIPFIKLNINSSAEEYIALKLGSKIIANWIMKTPFFKSLLNMLPGLGQMILFGDILHRLQEDEELIIVVDSPSSGHLLTLFESSHNFKEIFKKGPLVNDIDRIHRLLDQKSFLKMIILTLPSTMAIQEAIELQDSLKLLDIQESQLIVNDLLSLSKELKEVEKEKIPDFLKKKISIEQESLKKLQDPSLLLPHLISASSKELIEKVEIELQKGQSS